MFTKVSKPNKGKRRMEKLTVKFRYFCRNILDTDVTKLAKAINWSYHTLKSYEDGKRDPQMRKFLELCKTLKIDFVYFLDDEIAVENVGRYFYGNHKKES